MLGAHTHTHSDKNDTYDAVDCPGCPGCRGQVGPYKFEKGDQSVGQGVLLCTAGSDPLQGGALAYGRIEMLEDFGSQGVRLLLNVGGKNEVRNLDQKRSLDVYSSVNLVAFERQFQALKKIATASGAKRFPLWDLLPLSGVGGDILDSWAARMRNAVNGSKGAKGRRQAQGYKAHMLRAVYWISSSI